MHSEQLSKHTVCATAAVVADKEPPSTYVDEVVLLIMSSRDTSKAPAKGSNIFIQHRVG